MVAIYQIGFLARRIPCFAPWAIPRYNGCLILPSPLPDLRSRTKCQKPSFSCCDTILMLSVVVQSNEIHWIPSLHTTPVYSVHLDKHNNDIGGESKYMWICGLEWLEMSAFISCNKYDTHWVLHLEAWRGVCVSAKHRGVRWAFTIN